MQDPSTSLSNRVELRTASPEDEEFLRLLYFSLRDDLSAMFSDRAQLEQMLLIQYLGQKQTYEREFPAATHDIILLDGEPVGRLLIDRRPDVILGVDLALLPTSRNLGIGTYVLNCLFDEAADRCLPFLLSVVRSNPAIRLYERLGCRADGGNATHLFMRWQRGKEA
jgi:GNAT superfamily N-acetyltransferase